MEHEKFFLGMLLFLGVFLGAVFFSPLGNGNNLALLPSVIKRNQATISKPAPVVSQNRAIIVKLKPEVSQGPYLALSKNPKQAKELIFLKELKGSPSEPLWGRPLFNLNLRAGQNVPSAVKWDPLLQDLSSFLILKFNPNADLNRIISDIKKNKHVEYAVPNPLTRASPISMVIASTYSKAVISGAESVGNVSAGLSNPVCCPAGSTRCCNEARNACNEVCSDTESGPALLDCVKRCDATYGKCMGESGMFCFDYRWPFPPPPPPTASPGGGTGNGGAAGIFFDAGGGCDPLFDPETFCPSGDSGRIMY